MRTREMVQGYGDEDDKCTIRHDTPPSRLELQSYPKVIDIDKWTFMIPGLTNPSNVRFSTRLLPSRVKIRYGEVVAFAKLLPPKFEGAPPLHGTQTRSLNSHFLHQSAQ